MVGRHPVTRKVLRWAALPWALALIGVAHPIAADAQERFPAYVSLYTVEQVEWLDNTYRLDQLCPDPATVGDCHTRHLAPKLLPIPLFSEPDRGSERLGTLFVIATPGRGLTAEYFPVVGEAPGEAFTPHLFDPDWGYGPYFHHTLLERLGSWARIPAGPWGEPAWFVIVDDTPRNAVFWIGADMVVTMREDDGENSSWYVVEATDDTLTLRPEVPADMWCESGNPPITPLGEPRIFTRAELLDADRRLRVRPKYTRGC